MSIKELAAQAGLRSAVLLRMYGTEAALCDSEIEELRQLELFAELVAAHEREACANVAEKRVLLDDNKDKKIGYSHACKVIAEGIRARSKL